MKKTPAATKATTSAQNSAIFTYPPQKASACAEVLAHLLAGEAITSADTLADASTMRAAAHADYLQKRYCWPIVSERRAVGCADGCIAELVTKLVTTEKRNAWAGDTATMERFNYPVFLDMLPIPSDLIETGDSLIERWEQHVYEERPWPPGNSLAVFARDCRAFVCRLESALPDGYEIADEHTAKLMRVAEAIEDVPLARGLTPPSM